MSRFPDIDPDAWSYAVQYLDGPRMTVQVRHPEGRLTIHQITGGDAELRELMDSFRAHESGASVTG